MYRSPASRDSTQELSVVGDAGMAGEGMMGNKRKGNKIKGCWEKNEGMMGDKMMGNPARSQRSGPNRCAGPSASRD